MGNAAATVRTAIFAVVFGGLTAGYCICAIMAAWFSQSLLRKVCSNWATLHHYCARFILGIRIRIEGNLDQGPALYVMKHEADFETFELMHIMKQPAPIAKGELGEIPVWGYVARIYGMVLIDRAGGAATLRKMRKQVKARIAENRPVVLFAEGTRVSHGTVAPLRSGFAGLYKLLSLPVIPVAVDSGRLIRKGRFARLPGTITFKVGEMIPPGLERAEIEGKTLTAINALNRTD